MASPDANCGNHSTTEFWRRTTLHPEFEHKLVYDVDVSKQGTPRYLHSELANTPMMPDMCWFYCERASPVGGETTVADGIALFELLSVDFRELFLRRNISYVWHLAQPHFGNHFQEQVRDMGIREVLSAPRSPWQRAYIERVIGSIRRECLDHVIVFNESSLRRILSWYCDYYHRSRTHLSLGKDSPEPRSIQPPGTGAVVAFPQVGGLHHRYERRAA